MCTKVNLNLKAEILQDQHFGLIQLRVTYEDSLNKYCKKCMEKFKENPNVDIEVQRTMELNLRYSLIL